MIGSTLGAMTAIVFGTKKGHKMQKDLMDKYHEFEDVVKDYTHGKTRQVKQALHKMSKGMDKKVRSALHKITHAKAEVKRKHRKVKKTYRRAKKAYHFAKKIARKR
jgi:gas vesicle protein